MYGDRPRVTPQEWEERVRPELRDQGMNDHQLDRLQGMFEQSFQVNPALPDWKPGVDQATLDQTMSYMKEHQDSAVFDEHQLDVIESTMQKYIDTRSP